MTSHSLPQVAIPAACAVQPPVITGVQPADVTAIQPPVINAVQPVTVAVNKANDFVCVDTTTFKHFTSPSDFVLGQCPAGLCFTRVPPAKNPCVGQANAQRIDKVV